MGLDSYVLDEFVDHISVFDEGLWVFAFGGGDPSLRFEVGQSEEGIESLQCVSNFD
jgi:hypothetical protein